MVTTLRVVWIEIRYYAKLYHPDCVTTLRVVWIEIQQNEQFLRIFWSPPCGWCGLKSLPKLTKCTLPIVTTLRVVWIEMSTSSRSLSNSSVTTLRVVWIEMMQMHYQKWMELCHHLAGGVD